MSMQLIVSDILKSYNGEPILKGCSIAFDKSGIYVLTGRNGCGKSTFLRICSLIEEPDGGEVIFRSGGVPLPKDIELRRRITLLLAGIGIFNTTVYKNVAYGLEIRGLSREEIEKKAHGALEFVGLTHKKNQKALTLSSGEAQRMGIARAIVTEPEIIFLDEPTSSVDRKNVELIEEIILGMKRDHESIVVVTTHDMSQAERLADKLLLIEDGRIVER